MRDERKFLYERVYDSLKKDILSGAIKGNDLLPSEKDIADKDVDTIVEAINMGEEPDFKDTSKRKCHILWEIKKGSSGFGLSLYGCRYVASLAAVGARRAFNSEPQALHAAKHFQRQYEVEYFGE